MGNVLLYDLSMQEVVMRGVKWLEFNVDPPSAERNTEKVYHGDITLGKTRNSRLIQAKAWYKAYDALDFKLLRDELFVHLNPHKSFYAVDGDMPGRRWKVEVESININRINRTTAEVAVVFYCAKGVSESVYKTLDGFNMDSGMWATGMGLEADESKQDYTHSSDFFGIHNAGSVEVDPRESELLITVRAINGGSSKFSVKNMSTSETWEYTGTINAGDIFHIDGVKSTRNYANIVGNTNLELISLVPGANSFLVDGLNAGFEITFDFRYLYL